MQWIKDTKSHSTAVDMLKDNTRIHSKDSTRNLQQSSIMKQACAVADFCKSNFFCTQHGAELHFQYLSVKICK